MELIESLKAQIKDKNIKIVLPEGTEIRIIGAASRLNKEGILKPILIGDPVEIKKISVENDMEIEGIEIINPRSYDGFEEMVSSFVARRNGKRAGLLKKQRSLNNT